MWGHTCKPSTWKAQKKKKAKTTSQKESRTEYSEPREQNVHHKVTGRKWETAQLVEQPSAPASAWTRP